MQDPYERQQIRRAYDEELARKREQNRQRALEQQREQDEKDAS